MSTIQPVRFQLKRTAGWRKPENSLSVARPTMWGNIFVVRGPYPETFIPFHVYCNAGPGAGRCVGKTSSKSDAHQLAVEFFAKWFDKTIAEPGSELYEFRMTYGWQGFQLACVCQKLLHDKSLGCWCALDMVCHGKVILQCANPELTEKQE